MTYWRYTLSVTLIDQINRHKYLYLDELGEPRENELRMVVSKAIASDETENLELGNTRLSGRPIISNESSSRYEIIFDSYIAYTVLTESYVAGDPNDPNIGLLFRSYSNSVFLDYVSKATFATDEFPGIFTHYEIVCLNHIIEVASVTEPKVSRIR